ncbi:hypothetical protein, variant [Saprolegnia diclina VS20]|uniref:C2 domain-containing protein n=1 Tax=Saprolegnia diclina (strain VS20) TaxID=1156394 RepID=T0QQ72_SAPDV|nr:hypothetical protein, variant [Saprolegnia diclina VS20]EQC40284.1 hypothetical protein, variant [Saprolegnia diclina VS20]|eukprot:XP_008605983.1 hypothetical protein, variant [Saprolegnia diclina VS20]
MAVELHVTLIEARGLARAQLFGTQDPYCILTLGTRSERTEYHDNGGAAPFWNAPFVFSFKTHTDKAVLDIDIRNANAAFLPDNSIGFVSIRIDLALWRDRELRQEWLPVYRKQAKARTPNGAKPDGGELNVRMEVLYDTTLASQPSVVVLTKPVAKPMLVSPPKSPVAASPTSRPMTPSRVVPPPSPSNAVPSSPSHSDYRQHDCLKPFGGYWIPPERWTLDRSHTANALLVGNVGKESVLLQLALSVVDVTSILSTYATLPKDHMLLRLRGFSLHEHAWCVLYEHAVPLTHVAAEPWSRATTAVAMDIASAMTQLHLAKVIHGGIRHTAVFKDDNDRYRLHGFPSARPTTGDAVDLPWYNI